MTKNLVIYDQNFSDSFAKILVIQQHESILAGHHPQRMCRQPLRQTLHQNDPRAHSNALFGMVVRQRRLSTPRTRPIA